MSHRLDFPRKRVFFRRHIRALALPALMSLLVDPILSLVDTAYVGRGLGAISLAALGDVDRTQRPFFYARFATITTPEGTSSILHQTLV